MATDCRDFLYFQLQKEAILKNMQHVLATSQYPMQVNQEASHASDSVYLFISKIAERLWRKWLPNLILFRAWEFFF